MTEQTDKVLIDQIFKFFDDKKYCGCSFALREYLKHNNNRCNVMEQNLIVAEFMTSMTDGKKLIADLLRSMNMSSTDLESILPEDIDSPEMFYNLAVVYFHYKQYGQANQILEKLSKNQFNINSKVAVKAKLLHIDTSLKLQDYDKAMNEIKKLEALLQSNSAALLQSNSEASESLPSSSTSFTQRTVSPGLNLPCKPELSKFDLQTKTKLQQMKTACYLSMRSLKSAKRECKLLFGLLGNSGQTQGTSAAMQLKAYHDYLRGNMKKSLRIIKSIPTSQEKSNTLLEFLNSGNHPAAISSNNEGCCHFYLGRPVVASYYFQNAFKLYDEYQATNKLDLPLHALNFDRSFEVLYNFGVTMLHLKESVRAFNALTACLPEYFCNPRLWLRIAECCIQIYKPTNEVDLVCTERSRGRLEGVVGDGNSGKLVFAQRPGEGNRNLDSSGHKMSQGDMTSEIIGQVPTLAYASVCIDNALHLVKADSVQRDVILHVRPSNPLTSLKEIYALHAAILAAGAYISLSIGDYTVAVKRSRELLTLRSVPGAYHYLARMYLSQALFYLGEENEAIQLTDQEQHGVDLRYCISPTDTGGTDEKKDDSVDSGWLNSGVNSSTAVIKPVTEWYPKDEATAKMAVVYNCACMWALSGHFDKASSVIKAWIASSGSGNLPAEFLMLAVYIHIKLGNLDKARSLLKEPSSYSSSSHKVVFWCYCSAGRDLRMIIVKRFNSALQCLPLHGLETMGTA